MINELIRFPYMAEYRKSNITLSLLRPCILDKNPCPSIHWHKNLIVTFQIIKSTLKIVERAIQITVSKSTSFRKQYCQLIIEPENLATYSTYDFSKLTEIFTHGYEYTKNILELFLKEPVKHPGLFTSKHAA